MSYDIHVYRKEVKEIEQLSVDKDFFEKKENLLPFTDKQKEYLISRLLKYQYIIDREGEYGVHFKFSEDEGINVLLSDYALYFSSTGEGIFEISMTASEFTDTGEYAKYDPQNNGWEEL